MTLTFDLLTYKINRALVPCLGNGEQLLNNGLDVVLCMCTVRATVTLTFDLQKHSSWPMLGNVSVNLYESTDVLKL